MFVFRSAFFRGARLEAGERGLYCGGWRLTKQNSSHIQYLSRFVSTLSLRKARKHELK